MANWSNPTVSSLYNDYTTEFRDRDLDVAKGMDPAVVTVTNPVANMVRWNSANRFWEIYNGASYVALASYYAIEVGAFTGDVTKAAGASVLTIGADKVVDTMLRNSSALSVIGRAANSSGDPADIAAGADDRLLTRVASALAWTQLTAGMFPNDVVTYAKIQNVSATDRMLGRSSAGAGDIEEITVTTAGRAILDDADSAAQRTTLGLGTLATQSGTFSGTSSGTNTGDQTITLTGDVTGSGTGSFAATLASAVVAQGKLKTTVGEVSAAGVAGNLGLPGGQYGFYPQLKTVGAFNINEQIAFGVQTTSLSTNIFIDASSDPGSTGYADQRYVQASPPYDLGDGEVPLFIFAVINSLSVVEMISCSPDPIWANNGPTNIRPDFVDAAGRPMQFVRIVPPALKARLANRATRVDALVELSELPLVTREITQAVKQADMPLIPHPFLANNLAWKTIVLLDPVSALVAKLQALHATGESINALLHEGYLTIGNTPLVRSGPPGVMIPSFSWKLT